jgi:hypothetical protein
MKLDPNKISKKKRLFIFDDGFRSMSAGNIMVSSRGGSLVEIVDLTDADEGDLTQISANLHNDKFIKKVTDKIDKIRKERLK